MDTGIFYVKKMFRGRTHTELFLPIFNKDRTFVYSVLTDAMERWKLREKKDSPDPAREFYDIANAIGMERSKTSVFIGPEAIWIGSPLSLEEAIANWPYVFTVDFENEKIVTLK
jgi:hypothetical protein